MKWLITLIEDIRNLNTILHELDDSNVDIGSGVSNLPIEELKEIQRETFKQYKQGELIWEEKRN